MSKKQIRRRDYLLHKIRRQGFRCLTHKRTILFPEGCNPMEITPIAQLIKDFKFVVQFEIATA